jgi:hypothetical protein
MLTTPPFPSGRVFSLEKGSVRRTDLEDRVMYFPGDNM